MTIVATPPDNQDQTGGAVVTAMPLGKTDDEWVRIAREAYTGATNYFDTAVRTRVMADIRQFQGQHPLGSKYLSDAYRSKSKFFRPKTRSAVRKNEAIAAEAYFQSKDVVSIQATDDDDPAQQASAEINKELLNYRLDKSVPWFLILTGAYQDAQVQGIVCSYQHWQYKKKKKIDRPWVKLVPLENIRFDPNADWCDVVGTSPYLIELMPMYVKDVKALIREGDEATHSKPWKQVSDAELQACSTISADLVRLARENGNVDPRSTRTALTDFTIVWVHRNIVEMDGEDWIFHTLGTTRVLDTPRPLQEAYLHGERPYVIGFSVVETHKTFPGGPVHLGRDIQSELNENANQRMDNVKFAMNKRYLVKRSHQVDLRSLQRNVPSSTTIVDDTKTDGGSVHIIDTPDVTRSAYEEQDRLNNDFDDLTGSFSQASVQANRQLNETVGGMNILTKDASQLTGYQLRTFNETWVEPVLRQLVKLEQHYEDDIVVLSLAAKKANLYQRFGVNTVTDTLLMMDLTLTVNVGVGATNPHDQLSNFLMAMRSIKEMAADGTLQNMGMDVGAVMEEIFGKLGYKSGKRFFPQVTDSRVQALMQQVQQLQQALDAKHPPELIQAQVAELVAKAEYVRRQGVKVGVESQFAAIQGAEVITAIPQVSPTADILLQAAGYQPPVPAGVDPNLPIPAGAGGPTMLPVTNHKTGATFQPGAAGTPPVIPQNTSPMLPAPSASPNVGALRGVETNRSDSLPR